MHRSCFLRHCHSLLLAKLGKLRTTLRLSQLSISEIGRINQRGRWCCNLHNSQETDFSLPTPTIQALFLVSSPNGRLVNQTDSIRQTFDVPLQVRVEEAAAVFAHCSALNIRCTFFASCFTSISFLASLKRLTSLPRLFLITKKTCHGTLCLL